MSTTRFLTGALILALTASPGTGLRAQDFSGYDPPLLDSPSYPAAQPAVASPVYPTPTAELPPTVELPPAVETPLMAQPAPTFIEQAQPSLHGVDPSTLPEGTVFSPWLGSSTVGCGGPVGAHGPVGMETYFRVGPSFPIGGGFLDDRTQMGWYVGGGGRSLFFTPELDRAWTVEFGIDYTYNNGRADSTGFTIFVPTDPTLPGNPNPTGIETVSLRSIHRTAVRLTIGHEWWLWGPAYGAPGTNLRAGVDAGGFLGGLHADFNGFAPPPNDYRRDYDTIGGSILGLHSTLEFPFDGWLFHCGTRLEWRYTRADLEITVPKVDGDFHDFLFTLEAGLWF